MLSFSIKPGDKLIKGYYETLRPLQHMHIGHEGAVRGAFQNVLVGCSKKLDWQFVSEYRLKVAMGQIQVDGALLDSIRQKMGFWEAKDERDDLEREVKRKIEHGYPVTNIIFQAPERAILYQRGIRQGLNEDITSPNNLVELLNTFFEYRPANYDEWKQAIEEFKARLPEISAGVEALIEKERHGNKEFIAAFESFYALCRQAINPNLTSQAVERMLVQHLLTERIFRQIFHNPDFTRKNVIAHEVEKVIDTFTHHAFNRDVFLAGLDHYYRAIEKAAETTENYTERQDLLNTVYERFFQGYSPKEADTHGIVYTPQPIVDFMVRSVEDILKKEFGRSLSSRDVHVLDPFVGTGNFITRVMRQIAETDKGALPYKYENELHCNEVMLLPYYIASMNIEHEYLEHVRQYKPFDGICLVDTFELAEPEQGGLEFMTEENTERVKKQKKAPIYVIIGNPPYNSKQLDENDNNKNRKYPALDLRVAKTYGRDSNASLVAKLNDPYVKAIRWAADRIKTNGRGEGIVAFISNNSYLGEVAFDGMRKHLAEDFSLMYIIDLGGNVWRNKKLSGTTHNVFGIKLGVSINLFVRKSIETANAAEILYTRFDEFWRKEQKYTALDKLGSISGVNWKTLTPDNRHSWFTEHLDENFETHLEIGSRAAKKGTEAQAFILCKLYSLGVATNRDDWMYSSNASDLESKVKRFIHNYEYELFRYSRTDPKPEDLDAFVNPDPQFIKWTDHLKWALAEGKSLTYSSDQIRSSHYRPFCSKLVYFDELLNQRRYQQHVIFPLGATEGENRAIAATGVGAQQPFATFAVSVLPDLNFFGSGTVPQWFPFYTYSKNGSNRRENITDWALEQFRSHYRDRAISKWDIFHYVYAVLHHPEYRSRYAANLKRELPRIPFLGGNVSGHDFSRADQQGIGSAALAAGPANRVEQGFSPADSQAKKKGALAPAGRTLAAKAELKGSTSIAGLKASATRTEKADSSTAARQASATPAAASGRTSAQNDTFVFWELAKAGKRLAEIHVHYEQQPEYKLEKIWKQGAKLDYRVTKMRLSKDKSTLFYNDALTLKGIPPAVCEYRLGNRSALEWVIDQYQVSTDKRSGITNDPNRADDEQYILRLIGQVITVSLETVQIVNSLPEFVIAETAAAARPKYSRPDLEQDSTQRRREKDHHKGHEGARRKKHSRISNIDETRGPPQTSLRYWRQPEAGGVCSRRILPRMSHATTNRQIAKVNAWRSYKHLTKRRESRSRQNCAE